MALTQTQIDALIDSLTLAIAQGVTTVTTSDGKSVTYRSLAEMKQVLTDLKRRGQTPPANRGVTYARIRREGY